MSDSRNQDQWTSDPVKRFAQRQDEMMQRLSVIERHKHAGGAGGGVIDLHSGKGIRVSDVAGDGLLVANNTDVSEWIWQGGGGTNPGYAGIQADNDDITLATTLYIDQTSYHDELVRWLWLLQAGDQLSISRPGIYAGHMRWQVTDFAAWDGTSVVLPAVCMNVDPDEEPPDLSVVTLAAHYNTPGGGGVATSTFWTRAYSTANQAITVADVFTVVNWTDATSSADVPLGGGISPIYDTWTCPASGYYSMQVSLSLSDLKANRRTLVTLYRNGVEIARGSDNVGAVAITLAATLDCWVGDVFDVRVYTNILPTSIFSGEALVYWMIVGTGGAPGPPGPPGPAGNSYVHNQGVAAAVWTITHNLGFYPNVTVIDSGGATVEGDTTHLSVNQLRLNFSGAFSGTAYLS